MENQNQNNTEHRPSEEVPSQSADNGPDNTNFDDLPPNMRVMRDIVQMMMRDSEPEAAAEDDPTQQEEEEYELSVAPSSVGGGDFEEVPRSRQAEPEPESILEAAEPAASPAVYPDQEAEKGTMEEEDIDEEEVTDVEFAKEEEDEDADSDQDSAPTPQSRRGSASSSRGPVLPGKKVQTKAPFKRVRANPRPTEPEWPEFLQQPLSAQAIANPAGFRKAHDWIATKARDVPGLLSITKKTGLIKQSASGGLGDWKAGVITHFLNAWILHKHNKVLFTKGARDHALQIQWYDARSHAEQDEFRIWIMTIVEGALKVADRNMVQQLRTTQEPIVKPIDRAIAAGTWRHPTLGNTTNTYVQLAHAGVQVSNGSGQGAAGASAGGNGTAPAVRCSNRAVNPRQSRKRDREVEDDEHQEEDSQAELEAVRPQKKLRATGGEMDRASHGSRTRRSVPPPRRQRIILQAHQTGT